MKPTYTDLENDIREMDATIDGLTAAIAGLERENDALTEAIRDAIDDLGGLIEVPLADLVLAVYNITATLKAAL